MITIEDEYIEQIEVNTWKRLWNRLRPNTQDFLAIGAEKKLFIYNKYDNKIYYAKKRLYCYIIIIDLLYKLYKWI